MKAKNEGKPKRQHWVPRSYLRHFATPESKVTDDPLVWIFSKEEGKPTLTSTRQVGAKCYLYSPRLGDDTQLWDMENRLSELDGLIASIWPPLASDFVELHNDIALRKGIALIVSTLYLRHPRRLSEVSEIHSQIVEAMETIPKDESGAPLIGEVDVKGVVRPFDNSDWHHYKSAGCEEKKLMFVNSLKQNATYLAKILMKKRWSVFFSQQDLSSVVSCSGP